MNIAQVIASGKNVKHETGLTGYWNGEDFIALSGDVGGQLPIRNWKLCTVDLREALRCLGKGEAIYHETWEPSEKWIYKANTEDLIEVNVDEDDGYWHQGAFDFIFPEGEWYTMRRPNGR